MYILPDAHLVGSWRCGCLVTWFWYQLIAKPGNKTATWPDPYKKIMIYPEQSDCEKIMPWHQHFVTGIRIDILVQAGFEISNWMHLSVRQVDCKYHLSECTIHLSEVYKANATYVKIRYAVVRRTILQVFHLSDCHFYSSQTIRWVKFRTLARWKLHHGRYWCFALSLLDIVTLATEGLGWLQVMVLAVNIMVTIQWIACVYDYL